MGKVGRCKPNLGLGNCLLLHKGCCYHGLLLEHQIFMWILWKKRVVFLIVE